MGDLTTNFSSHEFGTSIPASAASDVLELARNLQVLRDHLGRPVYINSGFRTQSHNKKVGGRPKSQHLSGKGADIKVTDLAPKELFRIIETLISTGKMKQGGLGLYKTHIHYDIRGTKARW